MSPREFTYRGERYCIEDDTEGVCEDCGRDGACEIYRRGVYGVWEGLGRYVCGECDPERIVDNYEPTDAELESYNTYVIDPQRSAR